MMENELQALIAEEPSASLSFLPERVSMRELATNLIAFANADGGTVVIGAEADGTLSGLKTPERLHDQALRAYMLCTPPLMLPLPAQIEVEGRTLLVVTVPKGLPHVYHLRGKYLVRDERRIVPLSARRLRQLLLERGEVGYESQVVSQATRADLDDRKIKNYLTTVQAFADAAADEVLLRRGCLRKEGGELRPTIAGLLLFGRDAQLRQNGMLLAIQWASHVR